MGTPGLRQRLHQIRRVLVLFLGDEGDGCALVARTTCNNIEMSNSAQAAQYL